MLRPFMSTVKKSDTVKAPARKKGKTESAAPEPGLVSELSELKSELATLRAEVIGLRSEFQGLAVPHAANLCPVELQGELERAMAEPLPAMPELEQPADIQFESEIEDHGQLTDETLQNHPELADVMEAIELQFPDQSETPDLVLEDTSTALSPEEIEALFSATSAMGSDSSGEGSEETALSSPEPDDDADTHIVSAAEIQAMLGIQDLAGEASSLGHVEQNSQQLAQDGEEAPEVLEPESSDNEPIFENLESQSEDEVDLESVDPYAVDKVPGLLAAEALALPVCVIDDRLHCLTVEPFDQECLEKISQTSGLKVVPHAASVLKVVSEIRARYGSQDDALLTEERVLEGSDLWSKILRRSA